LGLATEGVWQAVKSKGSCCPSCRTDFVGRLLLSMGGQGGVYSLPHR